MLPVERWTVFFADGSTFTSDQGAWAECPPFGVTCVVYYLPDGKACVDEQGYDDSIYVYRGDAVGASEPVKMGLWTDGESYWRVHNLAMRTTTP